MGLTIHYDLLFTGDVAAARSVLQQLYDHARTLDVDYFWPLEEWGRDLSPDDSPFDPPEDEAIASGMLHDGCLYLTYDLPDGAATADTVEPTHVMRFSVRVEGAESVVIGMARHPATIEARRNGETVVVETGRAGQWAWQCFCKTQYASMPQHGGDTNFLRAHLAVVQLLDKAAELGVKVTCSDESGYWDHRDTNRLLASLAQHNRLIAAFAGKLKDAFDPRGEGGHVGGPIFDHPAFEHLEADGVREFEEKRKTND